MRLCCSSQPPRKAESAWSWLICLVGSLSMALTLGMLQCFAVVMPVLMDIFKESKSKTALVGAIAMGLIFSVMPLATIIIRRTNYRIAGLLGMSMTCVSLVTTSFVNTLVQAMFSYSILYGIGTSLLFTSNIVVLTHYFDKRHAAAIGFLSAGPPIGSIVLGPLLQTLIDQYGLQWTYRIMGGVFVIPVILIALTFDTNVESPHIQQSSPNEEDQGFTCANIITMFTTPAFVIAVVTLLLEAFAAFVSYVHLISFCIEVGIEAQKASRLFIAIGLSATICCVISGRVLDIQALNPFHVTQAGGLTMGLCMVLVQFASTYMHFIIYSVFLGFGIATFTTTILVLLMKTVEVRISLVALSVGQTITSFGNAFGPPFVGLIADIRGSYRPAFFAAGVIMLIAFVLPFLQYCFKPWRQTTLARSVSHIDNEVVFSDTHEKESGTEKSLEEGRHDNVREEQIVSHVNVAYTDANEADYDLHANITDHENQAAEICLNERQYNIEVHSNTNIAFELVEKDGNETSSDSDVNISDHDNQATEICLNERQSNIEVHSNTNIAFEHAEKDGTIEGECETVNHETDKCSDNSVEAAEACETHF